MSKIHHHALPSTADARKVILERRQQLKMAESAHAYVRGNTRRFYDWLRSKKVKGTIPAGPEIWICGDCHTGNLGPIANVNGKIDIQIRDLDQTVIGNPAHDLLRLSLSLAMAARSCDLPGVTTALMLEEVVCGYLSGLSGRTRQVEPSEIEPIRRVLRQSSLRRWKHLAEERIEDATPRIPLGRRFWPLAEDEEADLKKLFQQNDLCALVQSINHGKKPGKIKLIDAAYWMKGCSSLGRLRYAMLVRVGDKDSGSYRLLDAKEATPAAAPAGRSSQISNHAERVVTGARALSPFLGDRMTAVRLNSRPMVIRELRPQDLKFELEGITQQEAVATARLMAGVVGRAHGRQLDRHDRQQWAKELRCQHEKGLDAPRWLWSSVLDLAALHEAGYLEHCRCCALSSNSRQAVTSSITR